MNNSDNVIMKEREISLVDLCVEILLRWRVAVISMLVGAVFFAGFSYVKSSQNVNAQKASIENAKVQIEKLQQEAELELEQELKEFLEEGKEDIDSSELDLRLLENKMTDLQLHNVEYVLTYERLYEDKAEYQESSLMMQMDPNQVKKAEAAFIISSSDMTKTYNIQKAYEDMVHSGEVFEVIAEKTGLASKEIMEVYGLERSSYGSIEGTDTLYVYAKHYDENVAKEMIQITIDYLMKKCVELQEVMGEHEIEVLNQSLTTITDISVMNHQRSYLSDIVSLRNTIVNLKKSFSELEWKYYDIRLNGKLTELSEQKIAELEEAELEAAKDAAKKDSSSTEDIEKLQKIIDNGVTATVGVSVKYIILGMVLAAFVYVAIIFLIYMFNNKIRITDNLQDIYGVSQLGQIPKTQEKKKLFGFVDGWILLLRDRNKRKFTETEAMELATVAVKMAAGKAAVDSVYLLGCDLKERSLAVCEQIKGALREDNLQIHILNNILYDAQTMAQLEDAKCVVLVEKVGSTLYDEIAQELELLKRQEIAVLGGIVVE